MKKKYYRIRFRLDSALSLGSGNDVNTDNDLLKDAMGVPFIPGSSLAGIYRKTYRSFFRDPKKGKAEAEKYFGNVEIATGSHQKTNASQSQIYVYDAVIPDKKFVISRRDGVGLDEYKTAIQGAKFDFEVLEAGAEFQTYMEQDGDHNVAARVLTFLMKNGFSVGAKTRRGLGSIQITEIKTAEFELPQDLNVWLEFEMYGTTDKDWHDFTPVREQDAANDISLTLGLKQESGLSVRVYTTDVVEKQHQAVPDYRQLTYQEKDGTRYAVLPGTSWAGAFRHQLKKMHVDAQDLLWLYGSEKGDQAHASRIRFSESRIMIGKNAAQEKITSRNAIDRFTGGTVDGALYTEKFVYGGKTELKITVPADTKDTLKMMLSAVIADLHNGYMAVGGLTSVGRGLFTIETINGIPVTEENVFDIAWKGFTSEEKKPEE